jgi:hypothetical protein
MAELSRCVMAVLLACSWAVGMNGGVQPQKVNADAQLQLEFKQRIDDYMKLHERLEKQSPPLKKTDEPAQIQASQDGLAGALRAARSNAKQGDIFTPAIAQLFRRLMYPEVHGTDGAQTKKIMKEDAPAAISLKVNARYPDTAPLPTVPPNLLANLPQLPKDLEYRVVNNALILRDVHANLIVDFIPKAIR